MAHRWIAASVVLLIGCGQSTVQVPPSPSPEAAVETFMQSVADSNLAKMSQFWGTAKGSAAETNDPPEYMKRITVMQVWLRHHSFRIVSNTPSGGRDDVRDLIIEVRREGCLRQVPFQTVRTRSSRWIVRNIDLTALGNPAAPCS